MEHIEVEHIDNAVVDVPVYAIQWTGDNIDEIVEWCEKHHGLRECTFHIYPLHETSLIIDVITETVELREGDRLVYIDLSNVGMGSPIFSYTQEKCKKYFNWDTEENE